MIEATSDSRRQRLKIERLRRKIVPPLLKRARPVKNFIGSAAFVPSVAGLILAGEVVKDLISE